MSPWHLPHSPSFSYFDSIDSIPNNNSIDYNINLTAGKNVRVTISWLNRGNYIFNNNKIGMDFNLYIYNPNGVEVGRSESLNNPYEIVDFEAHTSGTYRVSITRKYNNDLGSRLEVAVSVNWE